MAYDLSPFRPAHLGRHSKRVIALAISAGICAVFWAMLLWPLARFAKHHL